MGANSPIAIKSVSSDWSQHLKFFERQAIGFETDGCVLFTAQESFDAQMDALFQNGTISPDNWQKILALGYGDIGIDGNLHFHSSARFLQVLTGNGMNGNPLHAPWDVMRQYGVLPWKDLPYDATTTQAEYFAAIPQPLLDKASQFLTLIGKTATYNPIQYHWVVNGTATRIGQMQTALPMAPLCMGCPVCEPWDQLTPPTCSLTAPTHSTMCYAISSYVADFDHYPPFEKQLPLDYPIPYVMQGVVTPSFPPPPQVAPTPAPIQPAPTLPVNPTVQQESTFLTQLSQWLIGILNSLKGRNLTSATPMSKFMTLDVRDFLKAGIIFVLTPVVMYVGQVLQAAVSGGTFSIDFGKLGQIATGAAVAYLAKNLVTNSEGVPLSAETH
jgi:hypothetical protein